MSTKFRFFNFRVQIFSDTTPSENLTLLPIPLFTNRYGRGTNYGGTTKRIEVTNPMYTKAYGMQLLERFFVLATLSFTASGLNEIRNNILLNFLAQFLV